MPDPQPTPMRQGFRNARLYTADQRFVAEVEFPAFVSDDPEVLLWGTRIFVREPSWNNCGYWIGYRECFAYFVPSYELPGKLPL